MKGVFTEAFAAVWRGEAENDGFNRLVLGAGLTGREVAVLRAYSKYLRQVGLGLLPGVHGADPGRQPPHRPPAGRSVPRPLRPRPPARPRRRGQRPHQAARGGHRRRRQPRRGPHPALVPGPGAGHAADELVPADRCGAPGGVQARPGAGARPAPAPAPLRDLRLLAPGGGRAPAGRPGEPGRDPLVGPPGGLPHRGPRPHEGPDGEERRHRPGRRQGRLRHEAAAGRPGTGTAVERPRWPPATATSCPACST